MNGTHVTVSTFRGKGDNGPKIYGHNRGFTLLEMMIVLVIIGIVATVMISPFSSYDDEQKLVLAAQEITDALRFGRNMAMKTGIVCRVKINPPQEEVAVLPPIGSTPYYHPLTKKHYKFAFGPGTSMDGVDIIKVLEGTTNIPSVNFDKNGLPDIVTDTVVSLSYAGHTRNIIIGEGTGRISLQE